MLRIEDAHLPGLADLTQDRLRAITGADEVCMLRLRYRPGKRAILHVAARTGTVREEGTLWFFKGDKGKRLARRNKKTARFDQQAQALFQAFPNDHRMPQIKVFLDDFDEVMSRLTMREPQARPQLLRYRPGLSCTFCCTLHDYTPAFVKLINDHDPVRICAMNKDMQTALAGSDVSVAKVLGMDLEISAIAYEAAPGIPLDRCLAEAPCLPTLERAMTALRCLWRAPIVLGRQMGPEQLLLRGRESAAFIAVTAPTCAGAATDLVERLAATIPGSALRPIHGDMKLEHLFVDQDRVTLIDTESVSMGLPDYDLAQLYGRLWQAEFEGQLPYPVVEATSTMVREEAGPDFDWCLGIVALRLAKFYAQRPTPGMTRAIMTMLERLR